MDESTCLESMRPGNGTVGSNPTLSAICMKPLVLAWSPTRLRAMTPTDKGSVLKDGKERLGSNQVLKMISGKAAGSSGPGNRFGRYLEGMSD